jgi:hypothetical protein
MVAQPLDGARDLASPASGGIFRAVGPLGIESVQGQLPTPDGVARGDVILLGTSFTFNGHLDTSWRPLGRVATNAFFYRVAGSDEAGATDAYRLLDNDVEASGILTAYRSVGSVRAGVSFTSLSPFIFPQIQQVAPGSTLVGLVHSDLTDSGMCKDAPPLRVAHPWTQFELASVPSPTPEIQLDCALAPALNIGDLFDVVLEP